MTNRDTGPARPGPAAPAPQVAPARRGPPVKAIALIGLLLVLLVTVVGGILLWGRVSAFNASVSTATTASSALWGPLGGGERVNIALFGYGGPEHRSGNFLADSIQIISIDPTSKATTIIPIPRDLWVEGVAELPDNGKINEAFAAGYEAGGLEEAGRLATEVLTVVTGLEIQHWMAMDFAGFKEMIDAVGGVTVYNPRAFRYTWYEPAFQRGRFTAGGFARGTIHLDGEDALSYARARYTSLPRESSDFARAARQQRVLAALRAKLGDGGLGSIGPGLAMMDALEGNMKTDLSAFDLFLLSSHMSPDRTIRLKEGEILEATTNTLGQYILVVRGRANASDYAPLHAYLERQLAKPIRSPSASPS
ncbi:MAG TPA: LCP family protein [Candidatus Limnocylindria bacterium]|nr:LCP family protein [Candidatus Limnocylindria bacterium]